MLYSREREEDLLEYQDALEILEYAIKYYQRTKDGYEHVEFWKDEVDKIKARLQGDYTEREARRKRIDDSLCRLM